MVPNSEFKRTTDNAMKMAENIAHKMTAALAAASSSFTTNFNIEINIKKLPLMMVTTLVLLTQS